MKRLTYLLVLFLVSCTGNDRHRIEEAEQILVSLPDSALTLLHRINEPEKLDEDASARYALASAYAHHLKGEDAKVCEALAYYQHAEPKDSARLLRAILLTSEYHWWMGEKEKAYGLLERSLEAYEQIGDGQSAVSVLEMYAGLANNDARFEEAARCVRKLIAIDGQEAHATDYWGRLHVFSYFLNDTTETERIYREEILPRLKDCKDSIVLFNTIRNHATATSSYGDQRKAIALQEEAMKYVGDNPLRRAWSYACMARYHILLGNFDEGERYMRLADEVADKAEGTDLSYIGCRQLMYGILDYARKGNIDITAWAQFINDLQLSEELQAKRTKAKDEAKRLLAERNLRLTIGKQRMQILTLCTVFGLIAVIAGLVILTHRKRRALEEKEEEVETLRKLVAESSAHTEKKDDRFFKKIMLQQLGVIRMAAANPTTANQELLKRMTEIANKEVEVDSLLNWDDLYRTLDYIYEGFHTRLKANYGDILNEKEIQLCCLLRANFSTKETSIVTGQSVRTVYQRKTVIRQKLGMEEKGDIAEFLENC